MSYLLSTIYQHVTTPRKHANAWMRNLKSLQHLHLPGLTHYLRASAIQDGLVRAHLDHKVNQSTTNPPKPSLLTFQTPPTYTCGRREIGNLSDSQIAHLRAGGKAEFHEALRGGQTTFHGPGQLTAYLIISLQEHGLNTRTHIELLEDVVIDTCKYYGLKTHTTDNPGVWIGDSPDDRKIASVGVHLRRRIASHGIGLNVSVDLGWFDRIVACGLVGKRATNIEDEWRRLYRDTGMKELPDRNQRSLVSDPLAPEDRTQPGTQKPTFTAEVADIFASNVAVRLPHLDSREVDRVTEEELGI